MANTVLGTEAVRFYSGTPPTSSTIHGFKIRTDLTCEKEGPGKTRVYWKFVTTYDHDKNYPATSTQARATIKLSFTSADGSAFSEKINGSYDSGSGNYVTFRSGTSGALKTLKSGSILVTHNQEGKVTFKISANVAIGGYDCDKTATYILPDNLPHTACSMPTSITIPGPIIIKPDDSFTVSWSGAQGGVGNPITGYEVFYKISKDGTPPTESDTTKVTVGPSENSYTFTTSSKKRGDVIVFGVKTLGTHKADNFNSDSELKTGGLIKINRLPEKPTVKPPSDLTVPSVGGKLSFSFSYGKDEDGQTIKLQYQKKGESSWTTLNSAVTSALLSFSKNDKTISFRTFDGLEGSGEVKFNITINTPPSCSITMSGESLESVNNSSGYNYVIAPTCTLSNYGNAEKFTYILEINDKDQVELASEVKDTSYKITDIRTQMKGYFEERGAKYRINVTCKDKYEKKLVYSTQYYYITKVPKLKELFNKHNEYEKVANFYNQDGWPTHYSRSLGYYFDYDTGYNIAQISNGGEFTKTNLEVSSEDNEKLLKGQKIFNAVSTPTDQTISFKLEKSNTGFVTDVVIQKNIKQVGTIRFFNLKIDTGTNIDYYDGISVISCGGIPECFFADFDAESCKDYGVFLEESAEKSANLQELSSRIDLRTIIGGNLTREMGLQYESKFSTDTTTYFKTFNKPEYYYSGITNKEKNYTAECYLTFTNDFADKTEKNANPTIQGYLVFVKEPKFSNSLSFKMGSVDFANVPFLHEGQKFTISTSITFYNTTNQKVIIQSSTDKKEWKDVATFSTNCEPEQTWTEGEFEIPANVQKDEEIYFRLVAQSLTNQVIKEYDMKAKKYKRFVYPSISIFSNSYQPAENTGKLTLGFKFNDLGYTPEENDLVILNSLFYKTSEIKTDLKGDFYLSTEPQSITFDFNFNEQQETANMALGAKITMVCRNKMGDILSSIVKQNEENFLNYSVVYNLTPTVAYRKNYLGINVFEPDETDIITIAESNNRNQIQYKGNSNTYCKVIGFILDGGTW